MSTPGAPAAPFESRLLYWSVRRELWENRSLYVVPLAVAGLVLLGFLVGTIGFAGHRLRTVAALEPALQQARLGRPFSMAASVIILFTYVTAALYCLDALYGERRDRSILFWKSLPVSDLTTVLSKASIPLVVLPSFIFAIVIVTQVLMLLAGTVVAALSAVSPALLWTRVPLFQMSLVLLYGLLVHALWHAPLYAWLLLVSGWAKRTPFLWAVMPPFALAAFERLTFGTSFFGSLIGYRLAGALTTAFDFKARGGSLPLVQPLNFLTTPGLWAGLVAAAILIAVAVRLRRNREPI